MDNFYIFSDKDSILSPLLRQALASLQKARPQAVLRYLHAISDSRRIKSCFFDRKTRPDCIIIDVRIIDSDQELTAKISALSQIELDEYLSRSSSRLPENIELLLRVRGCLPFLMQSVPIVLLLSQASPHLSEFLLVNGADSVLVPAASELVDFYGHCCRLKAANESALAELRLSAQV